MHRKRAQRNATVHSFFYRLFVKYNMQLCLMLSVMAFIFTGIVIITSAELRIPVHPWYEFLPQDPQSHAITDNIDQVSKQQLPVCSTSDDDAQSLYEKIRVLCVIVSHRAPPSEKVPHVKATWGRRCNKLVFMKPTPNPQLTSRNLKHRNRSTTVPSEPQNTFKYVYDHHFNDADWFMKANDDTYVIVENLRHLLLSHNSTEPIFFGHRYKSGYVSAWAGYVLNRRALQLLVKTGFESGTCPDTAHREDILVAACLERLGISPGDSRDGQGRDRFFPILPEDVFFPDSENSIAWYWNASYYGKKVGLECCSDGAISFRAVDPEQMYLLEYLIYHLKPQGGAYPKGRAVAYPFRLDDQEQRQLK